MSQFGFAAASGTILGARQNSIAIGSGTAYDGGAVLGGGHTLDTGGISLAGGYSFGGITHGDKARTNCLYYDIGSTDEPNRTVGLAAAYGDISGSFSARQLVIMEQAWKSEGKVRLG